MKAIETPAEYEAAMAELEKLMPVGGQRLDELATAIEAYERARWPIPPPTPEEAAQFRACQEGRCPPDCDCR